MELLPSSKQQRRAAGQGKRKVVGRSQHARFKRGKGGRDVMEILREAAKDRLPHLMELKYERMAASPFGYFRGAVPVMAFDLAQTDHTGVLTQLCGDAHVRNLGSFAAPDGRLVFDINDFDETIRGPFEWDVKRMAASIHVAARETGQSEADCRDAVRVFLHRYGRAIIAFAAMPVLEIARYQIHQGAELRTMGEVFAKAERETPLRLRDKLTESAPTRPNRKGANASKVHQSPAKQKRGDAGVSGPRVFRNDPPLLVRLKEAEAAPVLDAIEAYLGTIEPERRHLLSRYRPVDVAFKVVGTGSVGLRDYVIYLEGNGPDDPLFLQIKQEVASGWAAYLPSEAKLVAAEEAVTNQGQRVVRGQRAMQVQSDPFLGWTCMDGRDYLVRQLNDHKGAVNLGTLDPRSLAQYADLCGELLARGHARAGDPDLLAGYLGKGTKFERAVSDFAKIYADQTEEDWKQLKKLRR